jgi:hypothetical protein
MNLGVDSWMCYVSMSKTNKQQDPFINIIDSLNKDNLDPCLQFSIKYLQTPNHTHCSNQ